LYRRKEQTYQDTNNGNHNEKFNERETSSLFIPHKKTPVTAEKRMKGQLR